VEKDEARNACPEPCQDFSGCELRKGCFRHGIQLVAWSSVCMGMVFPLWTRVSLLCLSTKEKSRGLTISWQSWGAAIQQCENTLEVMLI